MPDIFVPADTSNYSDYYRNLVRRGLLTSFALEFSDRNRKEINSRFKSFEEFRKNFRFNEADISALIKKAEDSDVKFNEAGFKLSREEILMVLKGYVAANIWKTNEFYMIINEDDPVLANAVRILSDKSEYERILGYNIK